LAKSMKTWLSGMSPAAALCASATSGLAPDAVDAVGGVDAGALVAEPLVAEPLVAEPEMLGGATGAVVGAVLPAVTLDAAPQPDATAIVVAVASSVRTRLVIIEGSFQANA
jgi:hypothetical protein